jgi:hypothetical protein
MKACYVPILSLEQLMDILQDGKVKEFCIVLNGGVMSSRAIICNRGKLRVFSYAGDCECHSVNEMDERKNILSAMRKGAFYQEVWR